MSQLRAPGEKLWYSPARDITVLTPHIISLAFDRVLEPENAFQRVFNLEEADYAATAEALAKFCGEEVILKTRSYNEALLASGLNTVPLKVRAAVYAAAFEILMQCFYQAIQEATVIPAGEEPHVCQYDAKALAKSAEKAVRYMRMPKWKRKLHMYLHSIRRWFSRKVD